MAGITKYTPERGAAICARLMEGDSLRRICKARDMPAMSTVFKWLSENEDFSKQYARAREIQAHIEFEEILEIADDANQDFKLKTDKEGKVVGIEFCETHLQRAKLKIDTRKWRIARMAPKKYGDKLDLTTDDGPIQVIIQK